MEPDLCSRRNFLRETALLTGSVFVLNACGTNVQDTSSGHGGNMGPGPEKEDKGKEVTAAEDLMREHGILRRALIVYSESAVRLRRSAGDLPPDALLKTAKLFRAFGEDYHEKQLEEAFIFPSVRQRGGEAAGYTDILVVQHNRGREITDYIASVAGSAKVGSNGPRLADALDAFVRMYEIHAAREDTIVFPAWKEAISDGEYKELSEKFEDIEHKTFGEDGFDDAVKQIADIENMLKLTDMSQYTAPAPPAIS